MDNIYKMTWPPDAHGQKCTSSLLRGVLHSQNAGNSSMPVNGSLKLWCYAPGYHEENRASLDAMRELTGFQIKKLAKLNAWAEPTAAGRKLGLQKAFGIQGPLEPLFAAADAKGDEVLATYPDGSAARCLAANRPGTIVVCRALRFDLRIAAASRSAGGRASGNADRLQRPSQWAFFGPPRFAGRPHRN